ncbi:MAG: cytochrome ubiquinol oxidase subunit I [Alloprevotella sp.]|nr:cytochrome ubiquinol oxidase subunit I [Alloprevotella sp.]MBR1651774.1 cytochrome ubiquinol oxidase subunit I [Alloprevotella sp.]
MLPLEALIDWSRAQFALTACYHWLFVPLTLGLAVIMGIMETLYVVRKDEFWKTTAKFWMKLFGINFAIGVATGLILEFEFGTNWSNYSWFVGDIFGAPLAIEGIVAFFLEATFLPLMFFGWKKLSKKMHLAATWLGGLGATISAWWILVANAWMQHPVGMEFNPVTVRNEMVSFADVATQGMAVTKFLHTVSSAWMTGGVFVIGVCCWYLLRGRNVEMARRSLRIGAVVGLVATGIVMLTGDRSGVEIAKHQPMKLAAAEGLMDGGQRAPFSIVPGVEVPGVLSILATHDIDGYVPGINDIKRDGEEKILRGRQALEDFRLFRETMDKDSAAAAVHAQNLAKNVQYFGYGHIENTEQLVPPVPVVYWAFRVMVGLGSALLLVMLLFLWFEWKKKGEYPRWLLHAGLWSIPAVYLAGQAGWAVAEVGRQPWIIQDLMPVSAAISELPSSNVMLTFFIFLAIFTALLIAEIKIMCNVIKRTEI